MAAWHLSSDSAPHLQPTVGKALIAAAIHTCPKNPFCAQLTSINGYAKLSVCSS